MQKKSELLSYLRGYSIFTIVLYHLIQESSIYNWPGIIKIASSVGGSGAHIFFICSGFGLYLSYLNNPIKYTEFIKKRFLKIYIPYVIVILITALFPFMYYADSKVMAVSSHAFLFKMFSNKYEPTMGGQFWFISTIIQFYLAFYILIYIKNKLNSNKKFIILSTLISISYSIFIIIIGKYDIRIWNGFFLTYVWEFALGMILAQRYYEGKGLPKNITLSKKVKLLALAIICIGITGITGYIGGIYKVINDLTSVIGYGGLAIFIYLLGIKFIRRFFVFISTFAYEWYLVHILVFRCISHYLYNYGPSIKMFLFAFIASIVVAMMYKFIYQLCSTSKLVRGQALTLSRNKAYE